MEGSSTSCLAPTFFFEQSSLRRTPKRYKKLPEELPQDLRFAFVTPRVSVYLGEKEKESYRVSEQDTTFGDGLGGKSLLPQISAKVTLLQNQLNSTFSNDEDSQRFLFDRAKSKAGTIIQQLSRILYLFDGFRIIIPRPLEHELSSNFKDLTSDVNHVTREWQCSSNKEEYLKKSMPGRGGEETMRSSEDTHTDTGSISNVSRHTGEDDTRSVKSATEKDLKQAASRAPARGKTGNKTHLQDIAEDNGEDRIASRLGSRLDAPPAVGPGHKKESREKVLSPSSNRPKTRLEKFKSAGLAPSGTDSRASGLVSHRSNTTSRPRHDDIQSVIAESTSDASWIVHPQVQADRERETLLEWATQRLQMVIKQKKEQEVVDKEHGRDKPVVLRYYGDSRRDAMLRRTAANTSTPQSGGRVSSSHHQMRGEKPDLPDLPPHAEPTKSTHLIGPPPSDKGIFMTTVSDGSTTIFYPSGLPAIVTSCCPGRNSGFYTLAFDDTRDRRMLAAFTPSGRGCCYHENGLVKFLANDKEWTISDENGAISRRSKWPSHGLKMPAGVSVQLNSFLMLRVGSHSNMYLYFNAIKETAKVPVGATCSTNDDNKDEQVELLSGLPFTSLTAKEFLKPQKPRSHTTAKVKVQKSSKGRKQPSEIQKLLDMPEATENDAEADKDLYRLQRKIKNLVEDWLEHYRIAMGISSPHLRTLHSVPHRPHTAHSAKSSPASVRVVIESLSTAVPHVRAPLRIPSAPAGRPCDRLSVSRQSKPRPHSTGNAVKFDDEHIEEIEPQDNMSTVRITPFPSAAVSRSSSRSGQSQQTAAYAGTVGAGGSTAAPGAPLALTLTPDTVWSLRFGSCPVALRHMLLGQERPTCRCSRHKIPYINDIEYDEFIHKHIPLRQMVIISVTSSLFPDATPAMEMLQHLYTDRNRNRTQPCIQARGDAYRILLYDVATASELTDHSNPLLLRRHNVVPGMFLMYENGKLVFCDHIFNGYGNARKDFQKQIMSTRRLANMSRHLPKDFKFSPQRGKSGRRSAWGGEIGGAGVDHHGNAGISLERLGGSDTSLSSGDSKDILNYRVAGLDAAARFINIRVTSTGIHLDQDISPAVAASAPLPATSALPPRPPELLREPVAVL